MKIAVVSYSYTGNNDRFAACVARSISADHIKIATQKPMAMGSLVMGMIFSRAPKVQPTPDILRQYDLVLFFSPVWMGHVASPLRMYLRELKAMPRAYGFLSISGGAASGNPKLYEELLKRTGSKPAFVLDQHLTDFLPADADPARKDTSKYKISEEEATLLSSAAMKEIDKVLPHD